MPDITKKLVQFIQENWFLIAGIIKYVVLLVAAVLAFIFSAATLRACGLNWDAL